MHQKYNEEEQPSSFSIGNSRDEQDASMLFLHHLTSFFNLIFYLPETGQDDA